MNPLPRRAFLASMLAAPFIPKFALPKPTIDVNDWRHLASTCKIDSSALANTITGSTAHIWKWTLAEPDVFLSMPAAQVDMEEFRKAGWLIVDPGATS
jgi:hypothetical protein